MSDFRLLVELIDRVGTAPDSRQAVEIGRLVAHLASLLRMSMSVAMLLNQGRNPVLEAALVKDVGTNFERDVPEVARRLLPVEPGVAADGDHFAEALAQAILHAPCFTIRGGTKEILRGMIARGLGLR
jgi:alkylation response protein AidB-like acyl-CoA dehydrogenase